MNIMDNKWLMKTSGFRGEKTPTVTELRATRLLRAQIATRVGELN